VFPSLSDSYTDSVGTEHASYQAYLKTKSLIVTTELSALTPDSNFTLDDGTNSISMDGNGNLNITGNIYVDGGNNMNMSKVGSSKTITYYGSGTILVTGNVQIDVNLVTDANSGNPSFPVRNGSKNIIGVMTPNSIGFNEASIDVMGIFYAESSFVVQKQTDIMGSVVTNFLDVGTNVPGIFEVPAVLDNLPIGMLSEDPKWVIKIISWKKL